MPLFKQVAAQQKRSKRKAEALLSDEEGNDSSSDEEQLDYNSDSDSEDDDEDDDSDEGLNDDDEVLGSASEDEDGAEPRVLDEDEPRPPPVGFPTAQEAVDNTIASTASLIAEMDAENEDDEKENDEDEEDAPLVCVVCPNKILKPGKMVEVHLASKDHTRRFNRFKTHVESAEFDAEHLEADARWVASQLDKAVLARLSAQTQLGGKKAAAVAAAVATPTASTSSAPAPAPVPAPAAAESSKADAPSNPKKKKLAEEAEADGVSVREKMRQNWKAVKKERAEKRKLLKKTKMQERKQEKIAKGEKPERYVPSKPRFVEKIRPTDEEIETRQKWKAARNEAKAKGLPPPPKPVLAYELGGKVPVERKKKAPAKGGKKSEADGKVTGKGKNTKPAGKKQKKETKEPVSKELLPEV